jgi:hypothetical protein
MIAIRSAAAAFNPRGAVELQIDVEAAFGSVVLWETTLINCSGAGAPLGGAGGRAETRPFNCVVAVVVTTLLAHSGVAVEPKASKVEEIDIRATDRLIWSAAGLKMPGLEMRFCFMGFLRFAKRKCVEKTGTRSLWPESWFSFVVKAGLLTALTAIQFRAEPGTIPHEAF